MSYSKSSAVKLANRILRENRNGRPFRKIAEQDYPGVKPGTLCRFANSKGEWIPESGEILKALGLWKERSPFAILPKWFERTEAALSFFNGQRAKVKEMSQSTRNEVLKAKGVR